MNQPTRRMCANLHQQQGRHSVCQGRADVLTKAVTRKTVSVKAGIHCFEIGQAKHVYICYQVDDIARRRRRVHLFLNQSDASSTRCLAEHDDAVKRSQIRKTIEEHLDRELQLSHPRHQGVEPSSSTVLPIIGNDADGNAVKGKYARWFEEEYANLIRKPKYDTLFHDVDTTTPQKGT